MKPINTYIDHTLLKPTATIEDIRSLCEEAIINEFYAVCINGYYVQKCEEFLRGSDVKICSVIGFPLGANTTRTKMFEAEGAIANGAEEIDMVMNLGLFKSDQLTLVENEIATIKNLIGKNILKVIIETCYLSPQEITIASRIVESAGADFVKTSTGFGPKGASLEVVSEIKKSISSKMQIKASGGIRDFITAKAYIDLGVTRIGTSSGLAILNGEKSLL